jgi:hypothetical protein
MCTAAGASVDVARHPPHMSPTPPSTPYPSRNGSLSHAQDQLAWRLVVLGYITAIALPPAGLVLGIVLARRRTVLHARHGYVIIAISLVAAVVWLLLFSSGIADTSSNDLQ